MNRTVVFSIGVAGLVMIGLSDIGCSQAVVYQPEADHRLRVEAASRLFQSCPLGRPRVVEPAASDVVVESGAKEPALSHEEGGSRSLCARFGSSGSPSGLGKTGFHVSGLNFHGISLLVQGRSLSIHESSLAAHDSSLARRNPSQQSSKNNDQRVGNVEVEKAIAIVALILAGIGVVAAPFGRGRFGLLLLTGSYCLIVLLILWGWWAGKLNS